jgi:hypothetical protein
MIWLPDMDLNHDKQIQSLLCYRYTIGQTRGVKVKGCRRESRFVEPLNPSMAEPGARLQRANVAPRPEPTPGARVVLNPQHPRPTRALRLGTSRAPTAQAFAARFMVPMHAKNLRRIRSTIQPIDRLTI